MYTTCKGGEGARKLCGDNDDDKENVPAGGPEAERDVGPEADPRLVKSINKKRIYRGARRSSWWNETSSTVDQVMSLNKVLSPWPPH